MLDKKSYLALKKWVRNLCRKNVVLLCDKTELNKEERILLMNFYDGKSEIETCMELSVSHKYYLSHMRMVFSKINDYKNTFE